MPNCFVTKRTMSLLHWMPNQFITRDTSSTNIGRKSCYDLLVRKLQVFKKQMLVQNQSWFFWKIVHESGTHDVECKIKTKNNKEALQDLTNAYNNNRKSVGIDYTSYLKKRVDKMAVENNLFHPKEIWSKISKKMNKRSTTWRGLTDNQVMSRVRNVRLQIQGSDWLWSIENSELARMRNSYKFFLQFNCTIADDTNEQTTIERIIGFGNPYLFYYLSNAKSVYIDATFLIAPKPFYQCLVIMIFEKTLQVYLPILYILMTNKSQKMYPDAI